MEKKIRDEYGVSRTLYLIEAALEYFIAIMVGDSYLAKIAGDLGASTALTGVLYSFVSLGCAFQIFAVLLVGKTPVKRWITPLHIVNQLAFTLLWATPLFKASSGVKIVLFVGLLLFGQIVSNILMPAKTNWFMSLVSDGKRGGFTATKEIISLMGGMVFSLVMGNLVDRFEAAGNVRGAFVAIAITLAVLTLLHTLTLVFSREKPEAAAGTRAFDSIKGLLRDKNLFRVIGVTVLWYVINYATTPFYGSYRIGELGFSMTFCAVLTMMYSVVRALCSRTMGAYADKHGFAKMLLICFGIQGVAFAVNIFTVPANGKIVYTAYYALNAIAMAGINSAQINLIYDYVGPEKRTGALALSNAIAGVMGFLATLAVTPLVNLVQKNGNRIFGINLYAQQLLSAIGVLGVIGILVYILTVLKGGRDKDASSKMTESASDNGA